jgi:FkbM family methyltransferase
MTNAVIFLKTFLKNLISLVAPVTTSRAYLKYKIFHHKHDALINEIKRSHLNIYEEIETNLIVSHIKNFKNPVVLDVGANIGLISLNICHFIPDAICYAFEPSPIQYGYLAKNVISNNLQHRIHPLNTALGDRAGITSFHVHGGKNSSGDGLIDTGRAGQSTVINVTMTTLDDWWLKNDKPEVHFMKLDTEGAELQVLKASADFLMHCKPVILIEICYLNYEKYGVTFEEHIQLLDEYQYSLYDLKGHKKISNAEDALYKKEFYYLAVPRAL